MSDPAAPVQVGSYDTPWDTARSVAVAWDYAYVAEMSYGLRMVDVSDPAAPVLASVYDTAGWARHPAVA